MGPVPRSERAAVVGLRCRRHARVAWEPGRGPGDGHGGERMSGSIARDTLNRMMGLDGRLTSAQYVKRVNSFLAPVSGATFHAKDRLDCVFALKYAFVDEGRMGQTVRHYYYKLWNGGFVTLTDQKNSAKNAYNFVGRLLGAARRAGVLPWSAVVDPGRRSSHHWGWESLAYYLSIQERSAFSADIWRGQKRR